jgi:hypothetical protein
MAGHPTASFGAMARFRFTYRIQKILRNGDNWFTVGPVGLSGEDHYVPSEQQPRPYSKGFWAAFGHVVVDGIFFADVRPSRTCDGYFVAYTADYRIDV